MLSRDQLEKFAVGRPPGIIVVREGRDEEVIRSVAAVKPTETLSFWPTSPVDVPQDTANEQELR